MKKLGASTLQLLRHAAHNQASFDQPSIGTVTDACYRLV